MTGIVAFVGKNGSGKSLAAVELVILPALARGRAVLSNTPVFASVDDRHRPHRGCDRACLADAQGSRKLHSAYRPLESWTQLSDRLEDTTVFLDEMSSMFESRESSKMPTQLVTRFQQLRRSNSQIVWTAPNWGRADKVVRQVTNAVWLCKGSFPKRVTREDEWGQNRVFSWSMFDAAEFDEFNTGSALRQEKGTVRPVRRRWYVRSRHEAQHRYATGHYVDLLDHVDQFGTCMNCGGRRNRPTCKCPKDAL